jgi:hypothetical protein
MLQLKVEYEKSYYVDLINKLNKVKRKIPIHVDMFSRKGIIFITSLDDGLSASFLYSAHLKAKKKGLRSDLIYARYIKEDCIPEEIRRLGEKWLSGKPSNEDVQLFKSINITEYVFTRW